MLSSGREAALRLIIGDRQVGCEFEALTPANNPVYVKRKFRAYNFAMTAQLRVVSLCLLILAAPRAQSAPADDASVLTRVLPAASLWQPYRFRLRASGGVEPYRWRVLGGSLPSGWRLRPEGELEGTAEEIQPFQFTAVID